MKQLRKKRSREAASGSRMPLNPYAEIAVAKKVLQEKGGIHPAHLRDLLFEAEAVLVSGEMLTSGMRFVIEGLITYAARDCENRFRKGERPPRHYFMDWSGI